MTSLKRREQLVHCDDYANVFKKKTREKKLLLIYSDQYARFAMKT